MQLSEEREVIECYAFSKELIVDEMGNADLYEKMKYIEFLEFLVRCAFLRFFEDCTTMQQKVEKVMDILLKPLG